MGFHLFLGNAVVRGGLAVYAKEHRLLLDGEWARRILPSTGSTLTREI
jgi:hypothetical protein